MKITQKTTRNCKLLIRRVMSKLLDMARGGETLVGFDPSEFDSNALFPLPEVLKTWKERTPNEMNDSEVKILFPPGQYKGWSA